MFTKIRIKLIKVKYKGEIVLALSPYLDDRELFTYLKSFKWGLEKEGNIYSAYDPSVIFPVQNGESIRDGKISIHEMLEETVAYYKLLKIKLDEKHNNFSQGDRKKRGAC